MKPVLSNLFLVGQLVNKNVVYITLLRLQWCENVFVLFLLYLDFFTIKCFRLSNTDYRIQTYMLQITDITFGVVYPAHDSSVFVGKTQDWYGLKEGFG